MGQIVAFLPGIEGELQHLHTGKAAGAQQCLYIVRQIAQILGNDAHVRQLSAYDVDERRAGPLAPHAVHCGFVPGGNGVIAFKAAKVVDTDHIVYGACMAQPSYPPGAPGL